MKWFNRWRKIRKVKLDELLSYLAEKFNVPEKYLREFLYRVDVINNAIYRSDIKKWLKIEIHPNKDWHPIEFYAHEHIYFNPEDDKKSVEELYSEYQSMVERLAECKWHRWTFVQSGMSVHYDWKIEKTAYKIDVGVNFNTCCPELGSLFLGCELQEHTEPSGSYKTYSCKRK